MLHMFLVKNNFHLVKKEAPVRRGLVDHVLEKRRSSPRVEKDAIPLLD